jgi:arylsulfatase A-like enzyme
MPERKGRRQPGWLRCAVACWAASAGLLVIAGGCDRGARAKDKARPANIVLIVIDTLRADHLGCYGYFRKTSPNIDAFARQSVFFEQAYAPMATTLPAHVSLFTGLHPSEHGIRANVGDGGRPFRSNPGMRSIVELAKEDGCVTAAFVSGTPLKRVAGLDVGFDTYIQPETAQADAGPTTDAALAWLDQHSHERFFLFVHYFDPHVPYDPPPPYRSMFRTNPELRAFIAKREIPDVVQPGLCRGRVPTVTHVATNLYDGEIRYCDEHVGRLLDSLRQRGLWVNSVIILTADHGEGLNQHDWPQHGRTWNEQVHVPLMIRFPGADTTLPTRFTPLVSLIDVFPTVLGQLKPGWADEFLSQARGVDVLASNFQERPVLAERSGRDCGEFGGSLYALTSPQWRYHYTLDEPELLFDRHVDPHELHNVADESAAQIEQLRRQTLELVAELKQHGDALRTGEVEPLQLDPQLQREMEALGYVGSTYEEEEQKPPATRPASQPGQPQPQP